VRGGNTRFVGCLRSSKVVDEGLVGVLRVSVVVASVEGEGEGAWAAWAASQSVMEAMAAKACQEDESGSKI
jgi:hypothetical protein